MEVFSDTFLPPGLAEVWGAGRSCPRCSWAHLRPTGSLSDARWLCESCGHCWHLEHGRLHPVNPITCEGCSARARGDCIAVLQAGFPRFGANDLVGAIG